MERAPPSRRARNIISIAFMIRILIVPVEIIARARVLLEELNLKSRFRIFLASRESKNRSPHTSVQSINRHVRGHARRICGRKSGSNRRARPANPCSSCLSLRVCRNPPRSSSIIIIRGVTDGSAKARMCHARRLIYLSRAGRLRIMSDYVLQPRAPPDGKYRAAFPGAFNPSKKTASARLLAVRRSRPSARCARRDRTLIIDDRKCIRGDAPVRRASSSFCEKHEDESRGARERR